MASSHRRGSQGSGEPRGESRGQAGGSTGGEGRAGISEERRHPLSHMFPHPPPGRSQSRSSYAIGPDGSKVPWTHWTLRPGSTPHQAMGLPNTRWMGCLLRDSHEPDPEPKACPPLQGGTRGQAGLLISQLQASPESSLQAPSARL